MISILSCFEGITRSSSMSLEKIKLIAIVNKVFHVSDFLRLFMISFKYDLISLKCSLIDKFYFCYHSFHIRHNCYYKNLSLLLVHNNLLILAQKGY